MDIRNANVPDVIEAKPNDDFTILVTFADGTVKKHDIKPYLIKFEAFEQLKDPQVFSSVRACEHGIGVVWNDEIDISPYDIWEAGVTVSH